ncbi:MAG TPA: hypothetical protein VG871_22210 [Vicinamibacterales bacterium]|nr:hypothetical protein [Vicinamibacterales bacterium]
MIAAWLGVWTLTTVLSSDPSVPGQYKRGTKDIDQADSVVTIVDDLVRARGGVLHAEWTGTLDGRESPVEGVDVSLTSAYRQIDDHTIDVTQKLDGQVAVRARWVLSPDGSTLTVTSTGAATGTEIYKKASP